MYSLCDCVVTICYQQRATHPTMLRSGFPGYSYKIKSPTWLTQHKVNKNNEVTFFFFF